nr:GerMN domain-containing protein [Maliibacterium massiliense]
MLGKKRIAALLAVLLAALPLAGCTPSQNAVIRTDVVGEKESANNAPYNARVSEIISPIMQEGSGQTYHYDAALYFPYSDEGLLGRQERTLEVSTSERVEQAVVRALIAGPDAAYVDYSPILPGNTQILDMSVTQDCLFITFSKEFMLPAVDLSENTALTDAQRNQKYLDQKRMALYAIVSAVTEVGNVKQVQVLVDTEGDGVARRIRRADVGLSSNTEGELLEPLRRPYSSISTPTVTADLVIKQLTNKSYSALYNYIANVQGDPRPMYSDWLNLFSGADWSVESYNIIDGSTTYNGNQALVFVNLKIQKRLGKSVELTDCPLRMYREQGIWRVSYASLVSVIPTE